MSTDYPDHISLIIITTRYLEWLMNVGLHETNEIFEIPYNVNAKCFNPADMEEIVLSVLDKTPDER